MATWVRNGVRRRFLGTVGATVGLAAVSFGTLPASALSDPVAETSSQSVPAASAEPNVEDFEYESLHVDYTLGRKDDGTSTLTAVETFVAMFPDIDQNHGMRRGIPESFDGSPHWPRLVSITDENGDPRAQETENDEGEFVMTSRADDFVHGPQTYAFTYLLENVTRDYQSEGTTDFFWDATPEWRSQPIGDFSVTIHVPAELADALNGDVECYWGDYGDETHCDITRQTDADGGVVFEARVDDLGRDDVTVAVGFEQGTFTAFDPSPLRSPFGIAQICALVVLAGAIVWSALQRRRRLQDDPGRPTVIAEYDPPRGVSPMEAAVFLRRTSKAVASGVLAQAVAGSIRLVEGEPGFLSKRKRFTAELIDMSVTDGEGRSLLRAMFGGTARRGARFTFDGKQNAQSKRIIKFVARMGERRKRYQRKVPASVRWRPLVAVLVSAAAAISFGMVAMTQWVDPMLPMLLMFVGFGGAIAGMVLLSRVPLNAKGAELRDHLKGLEIFIRWAEADRIRMLQSPEGAERVPIDTNDPREMLRLYESLLPYAVIFGLEKEWAEHLVLYYPTDTSPSWYVATGAFSGASFSAGLSSLSVASASSSSTSSSGSSGGGSVGGGGGGGSAGGV